MRFDSSVSFVQFTSYRYRYCVEPRGHAPAQAYIGFEILVLAFTTLHHGWNPYLQSLISLSSGSQGSSGARWIMYVPFVRSASYFVVSYEPIFASSQDLWKIAKRHKRPFAGSTSSLTGLLSHCYFLISGDREVDTSSLSRAFFHQVSIRESLARNKLAIFIIILDLPNIPSVLLKSCLTIIDPLALIDRGVLTIETDELLSANELYPRATHAYIRCAQL